MDIRRLKKYLNFLTILFSMLSVISVFVLVNRNQDVTILYTTTLLIFSGFIFFGKKLEFQIFTLSFLVALCFLPIYTYSYIVDTTFPFIPGGDAQTFYEKMVDIANGDATYLFGRYIGYLYIVSFFYKMIIFIGISSSPYHFFLFSAFCGALSSVLTFLIGKKSFSTVDGVRAALLTMFFPILLKYFLGSLREALAVPIILFGIYSVLSERKLSGLWVVLSFFLLSVIRLDWAATFIVFVFFYYTVGLPKKLRLKIYSRVFVIGFLFVSLGVFLISNGYFDISYYEGDKIERITNENLGFSNAGSLSSKLINMGVIGRVILFFYVFFVPIPPPIINAKISLIEPFLTSIGAVFWYFSIFYLIFIFKKMLKIDIYRKISIATLFMIASNAAILAMTSVGTYRQKLFVYPLAFIFMVNFTKFYSRKFLGFLFFIILFIISILFVSYLIFKI